MELFKDIGGFFFTLRTYAIRASDYCESIPILGSSLGAFFNQAQLSFQDLRNTFYRLQETWDDLASTISEFLSWDAISDRIKDTWSWIDDIWDTVYQAAGDLIRDQYSEITDFWGNVAIGVGDVIQDQYSEITDFWGNVGIGIGDWFNTEFEDWIENRVDDIEGLGARILDKIW